MDGFEAFDVIHYDCRETDKKEKLAKRVFGSRVFRVCFSVAALCVFVFVGLVIYNDMIIRGVDYGKQKISYSYEQTVKINDTIAAVENNTNRININTAGAEELMALSGIGIARASAIIEYRRENGCFRNSEEIMNIRNISDKVYYTIKDSITVK